MSSKVKKYIITAVVLGSIAMASGLLIGVTNLVTKDQIAKNEKNKLNIGVKNIFGEGAMIYNDSIIDAKEREELGSKYIEHVYYIGVEHSNGLSKTTTPIGCAFKSTGSNMYGKISLLIGFNEVFFYQNIYLIKNEQTYASTLVENYVEPIQEKGRDYETIDVKCGATYGAKLVKELIEDARAVASKINGFGQS